MKRLEKEKSLKRDQVEKPLKFCLFRSHQAFDFAGGSQNIEYRYTDKAFAFVPNPFLISRRNKAHENHFIVNNFVRIIQFAYGL